MRNLADVHHPRSVEEALALLAEGGGRARPLAGGTSLVFLADPKVQALVDLSRTGLNTISLSGGNLRLGAMATARQVARSRAVVEAGLAGLAEAAGAAGSRLLQNQITVGGNVVGVVPWADLPPMLLALGATCRVRGVSRTRDVAAAELFVRHPSKLIGSAEILTEVLVPRAPAEAGSAFVKFGRTAVDCALCDAAAYVELRGREICAVRIAVGALRPLPQRLKTAESALLGKEAGAAAFAVAARAGRDEAQIASDYRTTREYRRELAEVLVRRALEAAVARATGAVAGATARPQ
ncbi:MAG TPA: FAD binding domain-containing protein [Polyangia bacterium]|jgi:carbon-monoxide dehydrogenase medium subunit